MDVTLDASPNHQVKLSLWRLDFPDHAASGAKISRRCPEFGDEKAFTLEQAELSGMLRSVAYAQSADETRYILNGVYFNFRDAKLSPVATDGRRLAVISREMDVPAASAGAIILPAKTVSELARLLDKGEKVKINFSDRRCAFQIATEKDSSGLVDSIYLYSKVVEGSYPNYQQVIPKETHQRIKLERELFLQCVHRAALVCSEKANSVRIKLSGNLLEITAQSPDFGEAHESMAISYSGPDLQVAFNPAFLMDPLRALTRDEIFFEIKDEVSPGVFKTLGQLHLRDHACAAKLISVQYPYLLLAGGIAGRWCSCRSTPHRFGSPIISIVDRWLRWFVFAFLAAQVCRDFQLVDRPYWVLAAAFFLLWFLGETLYNWLAISALSASPLPLFPRYTVNQSGEEWPVQPRFLKIRSWLRAQGFRQSQSLQDGDRRRNLPAGLDLPGSPRRCPHPGDLPAAVQRIDPRLLRPHLVDGRWHAVMSLITSTARLPDSIPRTGWSSGVPGPDRSRGCSPATAPGWRRPRCSPPPFRSNRWSISTPPRASWTGSTPNWASSTRSTSARTWARSPRRAATGFGKRSGCSSIWEEAPGISKPSRPAGR